MGRLLRAVGGSAAIAGGVALALQNDERRRTAALAFARFDDKLRPTLASVLPAEAFVLLYSASRTPFIGVLSGPSQHKSAVAPTDGGSLNLVRAMGLTFRNDLGNAAGLDKDGSLLDFNYSLGAGYTVVGTVLSEGHTGNLFSFLGGLWKGNAWTPLPLSGAALNSLGLPSKGIDAALENIASFRERHGIRPQLASRKGDAGWTGAAFPIGVSIMGHPVHTSDPVKKLDGVLHCVRRALPLADFLEINESCPNVHHGGGGGGAAETEELRARLRAVVAVRDEAAKASGRRVPILVKLGDLGDPQGTVRFLSALGVDGVVALNTQKDYAAFELPPADRSLLAFYTERYGGGLSGPPILDRSIEQAAAAQAAVETLGLRGRFTVIHVGGVQSAEDVLRSRATGAELRQWYTGLMHGLARPEPYTLYERVTAA